MFVFIFFSHTTDPNIIFVDDRYVILLQHKHRYISSRNTYGISLPVDIGISVHLYIVSGCVIYLNLTTYRLIYLNLLNLTTYFFLSFGILINTYSNSIQSVSNIKANDFYHIPRIISVGSNVHTLFSIYNTKVRGYILYRIETNWTNLHTFYIYKYAYKQTMCIWISKIYILLNIH